MHVYFIREKTGNSVKIGYAVDPWKRLDSLQVGNSRELELIAFIPAIGHFTEPNAHTHFHESRIRGEWFHLTDDLLSFINGNLGWYWENRLSVLNCEKIEREWIDRSRSDFFTAATSTPITVNAFVEEYAERKKKNAKVLETENQCGFASSEVARP